MYVVGVIEIAAGMAVVLKPRYTAYIVTVWLAGIIVNLLHPWPRIRVPFWLAMIASGVVGSASSPRARSDAAPHASIPLSRLLSQPKSLVSIERHPGARHHKIGAAGTRRDRPERR